MSLSPAKATGDPARKGQSKQAGEGREVGGTEGQRDRRRREENVYNRVITLLKCVCIRK